MTWSDSPCDTQARNPQNRLLPRERRSRVSTAVLKKTWAIYYGKPWPEGMQACHHCDEPRCSNSEHIFPGTQTDNLKDSFRKGRLWQVKGGANPNAKLTSQRVREIRERAARGEMQRTLAKVFGVSEPTISEVVNRKHWVT